MVSRAAATLLVNSNRLVESIEQLAAIGQLPDGGVRRIAFSPEDVQARHLVMRWMQEVGMAIRIDAAGNLIGTYPGKQPLAPAIATGSHIDTVPNGGRYDGAFGVLAGLEVVRVLQEQRLQLNHPVEVIVFSDEEGSMIGSKAMSGNLVPDPNYYRRVDGADIRLCLEQVGGNWHTIHTARRTGQELAAFVELHVEQGPVLESMRMQIGVVEGIVGQRRFKIRITGASSHAGTTPMYLRRDALVAASQVVLAIHEIAQTPGQQVATVGQMQVYPNAANVIPGQVEMSLDIRDLSSRHIDTLLVQLQQRLDEIAERSHVQIWLEPCLHNEPAIAASHIQTAIAASCADLDLTCTYLPSRASHDAQELATFTDMGMIFVPSEGGVSHAEVEYTSPEDCTQGANVLLHTLLRLDHHYST